MNKDFRSSIQTCLRVWSIRGSCRVGSKILKCLKLNNAQRLSVVGTNIIDNYKTAKCVYTGVLSNLLKLLGKAVDMKWPTKQ